MGRGDWGDLKHLLQGGAVVFEGSRTSAGATVATLASMDALRQRPVFSLDHEARKQIRDTRATILEHLATEPDDFKALVFADVLAEIDPDHDTKLVAHRTRFHATRTDDWKSNARELGLDRLLFHLADGFRTAKIGKDAVPVLERYAVRISEARPRGVPLGLIDQSCMPPMLSRDPRATISYHPSGPRGNFPG